MSMSCFLGRILLEVLKNRQEVADKILGKFVFAWMREGIYGYRKNAIAFIF